MKSIVLISTAILLSSCSTTNTVKQLQDDYNRHRYSAYVSANLKAQTVVKAPAKVAKLDQKLIAVVRQLANRKRQANGQIHGVINHNGLFNPSPRLWKDVATLQSSKQSNIWLKGHSNLESVLALALKNNLDIKSSKEQAQASLAKYDQVGFLDDMLAQYSAFTQDIKLTGSTQKHKKASNVAFPFPSLLSLKGSIIDQSVKAAQLRLKQTVQDVITKTRISYHQLQYSQQEILITKEKIKLLKSLKEELKSNYATSSADLSGILQADIEIANSQNTLQIAKDKQGAQLARLQSLLNLSAVFELAKLDKLEAVKLTQNSKIFIKKSQAQRVEIARLKTDLEKMRRIIQLSEKRFYPDFDAGFSRFQNGKFNTKAKIKKNNFFAKNDAYLNETRQKFKALQSKITALQTKTVDDVQQILSRYQSQKRTYALYQKTLLPKAKTTLDIAKNLYETGESTYIEVIDAREMIINYRLKSALSLKEMNISIASLLRVVGDNRH